MNNIDLETVKKFVLELVPESKTHIANECFEEFKNNPAAMLQHNIFMIQLDTLKSGNDQRSSDCFQGMFVGIMLAYNFQNHPEIVKDNVMKFIEDKKRIRGDNITNIFTAKKGT